MFEYVAALVLGGWLVDAFFTYRRDVATAARFEALEAEKKALETRLATLEARHNELVCKVRIGLIPCPDVTGSIA